MGGRPSRPALEVEVEVVELPRSVRGPVAVLRATRAWPGGVAVSSSCHRCSVPVVVAAASCPWCGAAEPGVEPLSGAVLGAWLLVGAVSLSMTSVLVDALSRALV